jgi:hypothetical protein
VDAVERLDAIEAIKQLKARYFRCVDTKDWVGLEAVFAPDVAIDITDDVPADRGGIVQGARAFVADASRSLGGMVTVHHGHVPEIEITSDTTARGIWPMEDMLQWQEGANAPREMHGYGHYRETYELLDGSWRIASMKLTRLRRDTAPV